MQYCEKCRVHIRGARRSCPLCQGPLTGDGDPMGEVFPIIPAGEKPFQLFFRFLIFISVASAVICVTINAMLPQSGRWSLFVVAGIACMWSAMYVVAKKRRNIPKSIVWQVALLALLSVGWDVCTGWRGWSIDYVLPILCVFAMLAMALTARLLRLLVQEYLIYLVVDALFGIIPILFYLLGWLKVVYPSLICVATSVISLAALMLFEGENMRDECRRWLHL